MEGAADELGGILHHRGHLHHPDIRGREPPRHPRHPPRPRPHQEGFHIFLKGKSLESVMLRNSGIVCA